MTTTQRLAGHGLAVALPAPFEGRIFLRRSPVAVVTAAGPAGTAEDLRPVVHVADFALPPERGDFGSGALDVMGADRAFLALLEFGPDEVGTALFSPGRPRPVVGEFSGQTQQRHRPGQRGWQRFFTENDRAFCLFAVIGAAGTARTVQGLRDVVDSIEVS